MPKTYAEDPRYAPQPVSTDNVLRSEHGRIAFNIDYRSHWFMLVKGDHNTYAILVKHGGGEERIELPRVNCAVMARIIVDLDDADEAYLMMHTLYRIHKDAAKEATEKTGLKYREAFVNGTLRKRKLPAQGTVRVWIEDKEAS